MPTEPSLLSQAEFRDLFPALETYTWLDTPGSPPAAAPVSAALRDTLTNWDTGDFAWLDWDLASDRARSAFADYVGVSSDRVAVMGSVAEAAATVASTLPPGTIVVGADEFRSNLLPWTRLDPERNPVTLVPSRDGCLRVDDLLAAITEDTCLVAVSEVLSSNGNRLALEPIADATRAVGARLFVDVTQSLGALDVDIATLDADYVAAHGYKWLLCPRGTAWLVSRTDRLAELSPLMPSWKSTDPPFGYFGSVDELPATASRLDASPAWFSWIGAEAALAVVSRLDRAAVHTHCVSLAKYFVDAARSVGCVPVAVDDQSHIAVLETGAIETGSGPDLATRLATSGVRASIIGGRLRVGFHYFNNLDDADRVLDILRRAD